MIRTWIHRIRPGYEGRLRDWLAHLNGRAEELRESFHATGTRAEQAYILSGVTGSLLVYISEAADHTWAERAFAESTAELDVEHRRVMEECVEATLEETPVYSVSV